MSSLFSCFFIWNRARLILSKNRNSSLRICTTTLQRCRCSIFLKLCPSLYLFFLLFHNRDRRRTIQRWAYIQNRSFQTYIINLTALLTLLIIRMNTRRQSQTLINLLWSITEITNLTPSSQQLMNLKHLLLIPIQSSSQPIHLTINFLFFQKQFLNRRVIFILIKTGICYGHWRVADQTFLRQIVYGFGCRRELYYLRMVVCGYFIV